MPGEPQATETTMRARLASAALLLSLPALTAEPGSHGYWSAAELDGGAELTGRLIDETGYFGALAHREPGPGASELHRDWADIYFVTRGTATLIVGGTIPNPRETSPGELRGESIDGGMRRTLGVGDVVHIPAGTAHHVIVAPGSELDYFLVKVEAAR
jgi:mannose-6-phosphate isomerase-like protein (cupin superfamily)